MKKHAAFLLAVLILAGLVLPVSAFASQYGGITIDTNVTVENGRVRISWTDRIGCGPYSVIYEYYDGSDTPQCRFWAGSDEASSTTSDTSFVFESLIAGHQYYIYVLGQNNVYDIRQITVPETPSFEDGKLNASQIRVVTDYKCYRIKSQSMESLKGLNSADIKQHMEDRAYGFRYEITLPQLAYARDYFVQMAMFAPNGYEQIVHYSQYEFSTGKGFTHYLKLVGDNFFANLYNTCGDIPTGTYRIELYFNGMLAHTKEFTVK